MRDNRDESIAIQLPEPVHRQFLPAIDFGPLPRIDMDFFDCVGVARDDVQEIVLIDANLAMPPFTASQGKLSRN